MNDKTYSQAYSSVKFEENKADCFSVAKTKRKTLALNYYGSLFLQETIHTTEFFVNEDFNEYGEIIDQRSSGNINNYAEHVLSTLSNFQNDERHQWKSHLRDYNVENILENLPCSNNINCKNIELLKNDFKNIRESISQFEEENDSKDEELLKISQRPKNNPLLKNYMTEPEKTVSFNSVITNNEDSSRNKGSLFFQTARKELEIQNAKKFGKNRNINDKNYSVPLKKSLGTRKNKVSNKFLPPLRSSEVRENEDKMEIDEVVDERLKNIDPAMIELIKNEIMDSGSKITWDDIAGLHLAKNTIQEIVVWPMLRPDIFTGLRRPPKGILLFGPPGTGKTLIGKCIASQSNSTFFSISASSLTSKWVGDGEKMVRTLFAVARVYQPSVVFIDEIDSLLTQRSDSDHECSRRIKTEFLVQLDGAGTDDEDRILIIGATNRPQELDEAARRRLVKRLYIPLPDEEARKQIIQNLISTEQHQLTESDLQELAKLTKGYSGADVKNLCQEASLGPIRSIAASMIQSISPEDVRPLNVEDFKSALCRIKSSVSESDLDIYLAWDKQYGCGSFS